MMARSAGMPAPNPNASVINGAAAVTSFVAPGLSAGAPSAGSTRTVTACNAKHSAHRSSWFEYALQQQYGRKIFAQNGGSRV
jgi:hypothetical protein